MVVSLLDWHRGNLLRVVNDELPIGVPAGQLQVGIFQEECHGIAFKLGTNSAFGFIFRRCILNGEDFEFGVGAAIGEVGCVYASLSA